jgi:CspA family cold shock protein
MVRGTVKEWNDADGWGVLVSPAAPREVWALHVHIQGQEGYRSLQPGAAVEFEFITPSGPQDGYTYRAVWVRQLGETASP